MPVEIKELVIRMTNTDASISGRDRHNSVSSGTHSQEAIVEACVKQVLKILEKKQKR